MMSSGSAHTPDTTVLLNAVRLSKLTFLLLAIAPCCSHADDVAGTLVTGIDVEKLGDKVGTRFSLRPRMSHEGQVYSVSEPPKAGGARQIVFGILTSVEKAKAAFRLYSRTLSVAPMQFTDKIGDEVLVWAMNRDSKHGTLIVRRDNALVCFPWSGGLKRALRFAKNLDKMLRTGKQAVQRAKWDKRPGLKGLPLEVRAKANEKLKLPFELVEANAKDLDFRVSCSNFTEGAIADGNCAVINAPGQPGTYRLVILAAAKKGSVLLREDVLLKVGNSD